MLNEAREVALLVYRATASFPEDERYGLVAQMRRAAISIGSNIAEGCGRDRNSALLPFLHQGMGSANELELQIDIASRLGFGQRDELEATRERLDKTKAMLAQLIAALHRQKRKTPDADQR
ncbi:MAG TPA: four helix bundle protein [Gemmatimonadaceae bacterium]|nr:four helix bundle protein [Gemmatimonadaceae bacterium]